ncbi:hypothetical protein [Micromonospora sp. NPDC003776]
MSALLDEIDWSTLTHAYGSAEDVPDLLRALASPDEQVRADAQYELYGNIYHQGTRFEATAYAVPYLLHLVGDPLTRDRADLIMLLASLATGDVYTEVVAGFPVRRLRESVAGFGEVQARRVGALRQQWLGGFVNGRPTSPRPWSRDEGALLDVWYGLRAYDAVRAGVPVLVDLLADADAEMAGAAAYALAWFPEAADLTGPVLESLAGDADVPVALAGTALLALALTATVNADAYRPLLRAFLDSGDATLRWAGATAWAILAGTDSPQEARTELAVQARREPEQVHFALWQTSMADWALLLLDVVDPEQAEGVRVELVGARLDRLPPDKPWHNHLTAPFALAFPDGPPTEAPAYDDLTRSQRLLVDHLWQYPEGFAHRTGGPQGLLRQHLLPTDPAQLAEYAATDQR